MNLFVGFEKWVKTLPIKFESCAFAFDAILVSFIVRHSFWLFFCAIGILPKTVKRMSHFFSRFRLSVARVQKMGKLQNNVDLIENG